MIITLWNVRPQALRVTIAATAVILASCEVSAQQNLQPRVPPPKMSLQQMELMPATNQVVVKFREGSLIRLRGGQLAGPAGGVASIQTALGELNIPGSAIRRMHTVPEAELDAAHEEGQRNSGRQLADLNLYYIIDLPPGTPAAVLANRLNALDIVEHAEPALRPPPPPIDITPPTPDLTSSQGYKNNPLQGIGVERVSALAGGTGSNVSFADVEYSWQLDHEDLELPGSRTILPAGCVANDPFSDTDHGTAVLGEIVGKANAYGVTGIAPGSFASVVPANCDTGYNPAGAITAASTALTAGDVIVIEQQAPVCGGACDADQVGCGPSEAVQSVFDAVSFATARGRIVVAAAGNGNVNLDSPACNNIFNRNVRDSGAIMVGAGSSTDRSRLNFSSYGSRIDVQGWGENVTTTGYTDAFNPEIRQRYTNDFGGTSGATPIVSGAVLIIQGIRKACGLAVATPTAMRSALSLTGSAQTNPGAGNIGPLPRLAEALIATGGGTCGLMGELPRDNPAKSSILHHLD